MQTFVFWIISTIAIGSVLWMLWAKQIVHSVIALTVFFVAVAILFAQLGAQFLAIGQILIFVGGIVVLMLLAIGAAGFNEKSSQNRIQDSRFKIRPFYAAITGGFLFFLILPFALIAFIPSIGSHDIKKVAEIFFNEYGILTAMAGLIIFTSLISAIYFLKKDN